MSGTGIRPKPSTFVAPEEIITAARQFCARQVAAKKLTPEQLRVVLLALGLDESAQFSNVPQIHNNLLPTWDR